MGGIKSSQPHQWIIFHKPRFKIAIMQPHSKEVQARETGFVFKQWKDGVEPREEMIVMDDVVRSSMGLFDAGWISALRLPTK